MYLYPSKWSAFFSKWPTRQFLLRIINGFKKTLEYFRSFDPIFNIQRQIVFLWVNCHLRDFWFVTRDMIFNRFGQMLIFKLQSLLIPVQFHPFCLKAFNKIGNIHIWPFLFVPFVLKSTLFHTSVIVSSGFKKCNYALYQKSTIGYSLLALKYIL